MTLKLAMTPSLRGLITTRLAGVRPSISLAVLPTASTAPVFLLTATLEGSSTTIPRLRTYTRVFTVPKSIARSLENRLSMGRRFSGEARVTQSKRITPADLIRLFGKPPVGSGSPSPCASSR